MIDFFKTQIGEEEIKEITRVAASGWLGYGQESKQFEQEMKEKFGVDYALFTNSCTSSLFMSMKLLDISQGDEVIIPSIHFMSVPSAVIDAGGTPVFVDVDPITLNMTPETFASSITKNTKAVVLLHYGGHCCDLKNILALADYHRIKVITDNANSPASYYHGKSCSAFGDIGCMSFDSMKIMTTIDGGALTLNKEWLYEQAVSLRYYGVPIENQSGLASCKEGNTKWWELDVEQISGRHINNDILAAIGRVQLRKLDSFIARRKQIWDIYQKEFKDLEYVHIPPEPLLNTTSSYYFYWLRINYTRRDTLAEKLVKCGIYCNFKYWPLHKIGLFANRRYDLPNADNVSDTVLNIPIHQYLTDEEVEKIVDVIKEGI